MKTERQQATAAAQFARRWEGKGHERGESQPFWIDLLTNVFGIETPTDGFIRFEEHRMVDQSNFIDARIPTTRVLIEQKSLGKDLRKSIPQSDGSLLNPFQQARRYVVALPLSEHPRWIVTCNFEEFLIYDMEVPNGEPERIMLKDLGKEYYRLQFLVDNKSEHLTKELQVSMKAGEIVGKVYGALLSAIPSADAEMLHDVNVLCVRLVFCLYAEDAGVFGKRDMFHDYLSQYSTKDMRQALIRLFETLATPIDERDPFLEPELAQFPYVNGGLFSDPSHTTARRNTIPPFTDALRKVLLQNASLDFDWSEISPTIFGAVFESTLNPVTRRSGGMHYTSIENIHKVIDPLFLDGLRQELDAILGEKTERTRQRKLDRYQDKLASLTFLDPACGSGNFLTETYLSLRRLENEVIRERYHGQTMMGEFRNPIKVSIRQFYGIEINDFAVTVATTALWISEAQMLAETERIIQQDIDFLPLKSYANIREGNALRMDWDIMEYPADIPAVHAKNTYIIYEDKEKGMTGEPDVYEEVNLYTTDIQRGPKPNRRETIQYDYIMGNPPFVGYAYQSKEQKEDLSLVCLGCGKNIDYVAGWYYKAARLIQGTGTQAAFVSTNSITQGEQVTAIWRPLMERYGINIYFAHRTFQWDSEASLKAHVHCIVIGFHSENVPDGCDNAAIDGTTGRNDGGKARADAHPCRIFDGENVIPANNINPYLIDGPTVFIERRETPICDVPPFVRGCQPTDGGNLILTSEERDSLLRQEPQAAPFIRPYMMGKDFILRKPRYCLWLQGADPTLLHQCPNVLRKVRQVRDFRLKSAKATTRAKASTPTLFDEIREPQSQYIAIPKVSSENRRYIPIDYLPQNIIPGDAIRFMQGCTLYHFGILTSNVHMAWMRATCGRLKSDYSYSNTIVYNNFPWPNPTEGQKTKIEQTAQAILDARALYPNASLADLYDELTMPVELRKAHQQNDRAVMAAYGFDAKTMTEDRVTAALFRLYQQLSTD